MNHECGCCVCVSHCEAGSVIVGNQGTGGQEKDKYRLTRVCWHASNTEDGARKVLNAIVGDSDPGYVGYN